MVAHDEQFHQIAGPAKQHTITQTCANLPDSRLEGFQAEPHGPAPIAVERLKLVERPIHTVPPQGIQRFVGPFEGRGARIPP